MNRTLKTILTIPVVIVAVAFLLTLIASGFVEGMLWVAQIMHLQHALGMDTQTSHNYASVSGVLPVMVATLGFSSLITGWWHHVNCHTAGCPRIGKHEIAGGKFKVCTPCLRQIDPAHAAGKHTIEHLARAHRRHSRNNLPFTLHLNENLTDEA